MSIISEKYKEDYNTFIASGYSDISSILPLLIPSIEGTLYDDTYQKFYELINDPNQGNIAIYSDYLDKDRVFVFFIKGNRNAKARYLCKDNIGIILIDEGYIEFLHGVFIEDVDFSSEPRVREILDLVTILRISYSPSLTDVEIFKDYLLKSIASFVFFHEYAHLIQQKKFCLSGRVTSLSSDERRLLEIDADMFFIKHTLSNALIYFKIAYVDL